MDIEGIKDPTFDPDIFNYLVLTKKVKDIVRKLTMNPEVDDQSTPEGNQTQLRQGRKDSGMKFMESSFSPDFIKGKGEGQVFLLHGPPGVGKTCTAGMNVVPEGVRCLYF